MSAIRKQAFAAPDNGLLAPEPAAGCAPAPSSPCYAAVRWAALADGRCSGGFTLEATVAARRANAPELSA